MQELTKIYGIDPEHKKLMDEAEAKKQRRGRRGRPAAEAGAQDKIKTRDSTFPPPSAEKRSITTKSTQQPAEKKRPLPVVDSSSGTDKSVKKSRAQKIIENNPAKVPENQPIANEFVKLGEYELTHGDTQRGISRMKAAKEIRNTDQKLTSGSQARALPGIGPSAAAKVDEVLDHGTIDKLEEVGTAMLKEGAQEEQAEMIHEVEDAEAEDEQDDAEGGEGEEEEEEDDDDQDYIDNENEEGGDEEASYNEDEDEIAL